MAALLDNFSTRQKTLRNPRQLRLKLSIDLPDANRHTLSEVDLTDDLS